MQCAGTLNVLQGTLNELQSLTMMIQMKSASRDLWLCVLQGAVFYEWAHTTFDIIQP